MEVLRRKAQNDTLQEFCYNYVTANLMILSKAQNDKTRDCGKRGVKRLMFFPNFKNLTNF